jgi:hypothetical protein
MASTEGAPYRLEPTGVADAQIRTLMARAAARGEQQEVRTALSEVTRQLKTRPHDWGDPIHRTHKEGGLVYRGLKPPLVVRYAVFEPEKVVWLLDVRALPNTPLAE